MAIDFDGINLIITLDSGVTEVDVREDIYEPWKEWVRAGNAAFPAAFRPLGGDPLTALINAGSYFFLNNTVGWRIKPPEEDITIYLTGNLAVEDVSLPAFVPTDGNFTTAILGLQQVTQGVELSEPPTVGQITAGVWGDASAIQLLSDVAFIKKIEGGRWKIESNQMIFYEDDNTTEVARFNLFDSGGDPAMENIYDRQRV